MPVFLSHSTPDDSLARSVYDRLSTVHGIKCYIDDLDRQAGIARGVGKEKMQDDSLLGSTAIPNAEGPPSTPISREPSAWSEWGDDGHDYSRTGKHDPNECRYCLKHVISRLESQPFADRMVKAEERVAALNAALTAHLVQCPQAHALALEVAGSSVDEATPPQEQTGQGKLQHARPDFTKQQLRDLEAQEAMLLTLASAPLRREGARRDEQQEQDFTRGHSFPDSEHGDLPRRNEGDD